MTKPLTDVELDAIYSHAQDDGWCAHDLSVTALQAIFRRVAEHRANPPTLGVSDGCKRHCQWIGYGPCPLRCK